MGVTNCDIHGEGVGIGLTCKHITQNIFRNKNDKCILVKVRTYPSTDESEYVETKLNNMTLEIPFCLKCYEDKMMSQKMKLEFGYNIVKQAYEKFEIGHPCQFCIEEYAVRNKIN